MNEYIKINPVGGSGGITYPLTAPDGTTINPSFSFSSNTGHGLSYGDPNTMNVSTNGGLRFAISADGIELAAGKYIFSDGTGPNNAAYTLGDSSTGLSGDSAAGTYIGLRILNSENARIDNSAVAGNTRMLLWDVDSGLLQRVKVTANNAVLGVTGRVLYVANI